MDVVANGGVTRGAYLEGRDEEILYRRMRDDMIKKREQEDAKAGIVRKPKKRTFFKQLFGCGYQDEGRIVPNQKRDEKEKDDVVR